MHHPVVHLYIYINLYIIVVVLLASVAAIYVCAVLYEGLKAFRQLLYYDRVNILIRVKAYLSVNYKKFSSEVKSEKSTAR